MPKPINWEQFTQLTAEEREQMKTFADTYGADLEAAVGIELNEDYVKTQIEQNLQRHRNGKQYVQAFNHIHDLEKPYPCPKEAGKSEFFARGYHLYLTDNEQENTAYLESLKTKEGQQAFINRAVKDAMEWDASQSHFDDIDKEMELAVKNPVLAELTFLSNHLNDDMNKGFKLDEPLYTAFMEKAKLIEFAGTPSAHLCKYAASPLGLLLPPPDEKTSEKLFNTTNLLIKYPNELMNLRSYLTQDKGEAERFREMADKGLFNNDIRLKDADGNYLDKGKAMREKIPYTVEPVEPEVAKEIEQQLKNLPTTAEAVREQYQKPLKEQGVEVEYSTILATKAGKGVNLVFQNDEPYPRKLEYDEEKKQFKVGDPVTEVPAFPEKPGFFKRLFHNINSNWFKTDFDNYDKGVKNYYDTKEAFEKVKPEIKARQNASKESQRKPAEKNDKEISATETKLKERVAAEKMKDSTLEIVEEDPLPDAIIEMQNRRNALVERNRANGITTDGAYIQVLNKAIEARTRIYDAFHDNKKPYRGMAEDMKTMVVERMLDEDRRSMGINYLEGPIAHKLSMSNDPTAVENFIKNVNLGQPMKNLTAGVSPYRGENGKMMFHRQVIDTMRTFALGNGAEVVYDACKESLAKEKQTEQAQKQKTLNEKQKVAKNPETKVQGTPNVLG